MSTELHTQACLEYAAQTRRSFCIDSCAQLRRQRERQKKTVERALCFLLIRIGSWTNARFDQHLRHEFGDEFADDVMAWLAENVSPELGKGPHGEPLYRSSSAR